MNIHVFIEIQSFVLVFEVREAKVWPDLLHSIENIFQWRISFPYRAYTLTFNRSLSASSFDFRSNVNAKANENPIECFKRFDLQSTLLYIMTRNSNASRSLGFYSFHFSFSKWANVWQCITFSTTLTISVHNLKMQSLTRKGTKRSKTWA